MVKRMAVIEFGVNDGGCDGASCGGIKEGRIQRSYLIQ